MISSHCFIHNLYNRFLFNYNLIRDPALVCLSAIDKKSAQNFVNITVLVYNWDIVKERTKRPVIKYLQRLFLQPPSSVMANIHSIQWNVLPRVSFTPESTVISQWTRLYDVPRTHDVGLPTQYRFNVGPASHPIAGLIPVNRLRRWPNTNPTLGLRTSAISTLGLLYICASTSANTWHSPKAVSILTHSLRRWPNIETELCDCSVFALTAMRVTLLSPVAWKDTFQITRSIHLILIKCWANIISTKTI